MSIVITMVITKNIGYYPLIKKYSVFKFEESPDFLIGKNTCRSPVYEKIILDIHKIKIGIYSLHL